MKLDLHYKFSEFVYLRAFKDHYGKSCKAENFVEIFNLNYLDLKTLDTIGNCQKPVFSLCVSQHE